ncbi:MAG: Calx-beta domain-containing protein, partial [Actinomycetota bacterium]
EFNETFTLGLSNLVNASPGTMIGTGTITDDDPLPTVSIADLSLPEGDAVPTAATLTVSLSAASGKPITVDWATADGTADGTDYTGDFGTLTFAPGGATSQTLDVDISGDTTYENPETFTVGLSAPVNVSLGSTPATVTIQNDDFQPRLSIDDQTVTEGNALTTPATFTVSLTNPSAFPISVVVATSDQTATDPADYAGVSTTVNFAPGEVSQTVDVQVVGDVIDEFDETFSVHLTAPSGATISDPQGIGTITDDDAAPVLDIGAISVAEGNAGNVTVSFPVTLTGATALPVTVDAITLDGTATWPSDYTALSTTTLTFPPGVTTQTVDVTVHGDTTFESDETFTVQLSLANNATIGGTGSAIGTILNDDLAPGLAITDVSLPEGNVGDTVATFTVTLGTPSAFTVTVDIASLDGTATQPTDYDPVAISPLTFAPGETLKTVDVTIHGDTIVEPNETYTVQLSNASVGINDAIGTGTIVDDDAVAPPPTPPAAPVVSIGDSSTDEGGAGTTTPLTFPVTLSKPSAIAIVVDYRTSAGSAKQGNDYERVVGSLRIAGGETTGSVEVTVIGDDRVEPDETFTLEITGASGATPGSDGTGTIVNDDRSATRLTLHVRVHGRRGRAATHRIGVRGRLINGAPRLPVHVVLMRERGGRWVVVGRDTVHTRRKPHLIGSGSTAFGYRATFRVNRGGRYRVRTTFRGDDLRKAAQARLRFRI